MNRYALYSSLQLLANLLQSKEEEEPKLSLTSEPESMILYILPSLFRPLLFPLISLEFRPSKAKYFFSAPALTF